MPHLQTLIDSAVVGANWLRLKRPTLRPVARVGAGRHLALLASALPPSSLAGVYRPLSFMRYGCQLGWRIDAFCSEASREHRQHGEELLSRVPREATLHVVPPSSRQPAYRLFPRVDGGFTNALAYARYAITTMADDPPDAVLASGPPFFTFVAALFVARRFGVPLVLDYRDEWTECPFGFVTKDGRDRDWERRCLRQADAVLFTTASHLQHQLATFPELDPRKAHLVPNGWEPEDFAEGEGERPTAGAGESATLRLAHVGNLAGHTPPHEFLDSLQHLLTDEPDWVPRIRVQFIGRRSSGADEAIRAFKFPTVLEVIDQVGKREASQRMQECDVLLLLAKPDLERYLPGKLFDYLAARRPVLVFGARGESSALIDQLGAGVLCPPGSAAALREALVRLCDLDMSRQDDTVHLWLQEHRRDILASHAFDIIESITARGRGASSPNRPAIASMREERMESMTGGGARR
jgi:glycosyltransferase involved in cell wall biosynthesis